MAVTVVPVQIDFPSTDVLLDLPDGTYRLAIPHTVIRLEKMAPFQNPWAYPVGSEKFPTMQWYAYQQHTWDPTENPEGHTGIDLNAWQAPFGDVDRGEPVWSVADGVVSSVGYSEGWLGVVVVECEEDDGTRVWFRYGHLDGDSIDVKVGDRVVAAQMLGVLGDYTGGDTGDHLHFDAALQAFEWNVYRDASISWIDPVPVLRRHLDGKVIDGMLEKG